MYLNHILMNLGTDLQSSQAEALGEITQLNMDD